MDTFEEAFTCVLFYKMYTLSFIFLEECFLPVGILHFLGKLKRHLKLSSNQGWVFPKIIS